MSTQNLTQTQPDLFAKALIITFNLISFHYNIKK